MALAHRRRAPAGDAERTQGRLDGGAHLRHVPAPRRAQEQRWRTAFRRRATNACDLARAARQSASAGDGRAHRRARAAHRRAGGGDARQACRGRRDGGAGHRAEHRRGVRGVRERRHHGQWPHQPRDRGEPPRGGPRAAAAVARCRASRPRRYAACRDSGAGGRRCCTRGSPACQRIDPRLCLESDTADTLVTAGAGRQDRGDRANQRGEHRIDRGGGRPPRRNPTARRERPAGRARRRYAGYEGRGAYDTSAIS